MKNTNKPINLFPNFNKKLNIVYFLKEFKHESFYTILKNEINFYLKSYQLHFLFLYFIV